jgi:pyrroloquinoline quinone biosynthesis protein B
MHKIVLIILLLFYSKTLSFCQYGELNEINGSYLVLLGTIQDAGSPHIGCRKSCCKALFEKPDYTRKVISIGIIDPLVGKKFIIEATPDIAQQLKVMSKLTGNERSDLPDAIFLTHGHIGHYSGLMYLGREGLNSKKIPIYAMPGMKNFIESNGPWDQLVKIENIVLQEMEAEKPIPLTPDIAITPFTVPHRGEYTETVGYIISGKNKKVLFIPDIDKWQLWSKNIIEEISKVDVAFLDATFYDNTEVNNRNIAEIPHPFITESFEIFDKLPANEKSKINFIHFNHTNPALDPESVKAKIISEKGYKIGHFMDIFRL